MRFKPLLFALPVTTALTLLALWAAFMPGTPPEIRLPESVRTDESRQRRTPAQESAQATTEPATPPTPQVVNDPRKGELWLRLIDFDSRKPLARIACALMPLQAGFSRSEDGSIRIDSCHALEVVSSGATGDLHRLLLSTDEYGLFRQSVRVGDRAAAEHQEGERDSDAELSPNTGELRVLLPVPEGWWLWTDHNELATTLAHLPDHPLTRPIDIQVRKSAMLDVNVVDNHGRGVPACEIDWHEVSRPQWLQYGVDVTFGHKLAPQDALDEIEAVRFRSALSEFGARAGDGSTLKDDQWPPASSPRKNDLDAGGSWRSGGFSPGRMLVVASAARGGVGFADVILSAGSNRVEVMLEGSALSTVRVRVEARGEAGATEESMDVSVGPAGPAGTGCGFDDCWNRRWNVARSAPGVWECVIMGLPSGRWWFGAGNWRTSGTNSVTVDVLPASGQTVTILVGEGARATWTPMVYFAGKPLSEATVFLLGGEYESPQDFTAEYHEASGTFEPFTPMAGTYTAWAPGLDPFTFTLAPGEKRRDTFIIPSKRVTFRVGPELAALLAPERMELLLNLYCEGAWDSNQEHLYSIDKHLRETDEHYDVLSPKTTRDWSLPPGNYQWELVGEDCAISGQRSLHGQAAEEVLFELNQTPELCVLEVKCEGFRVEDLPDIELRGPATGTARRQVGTAGPSISYPDKALKGRVFETALGQYVILSPRGEIVVEFSCFGKPDTTRVVACPGRLDFTPSDFQTGRCEVTLVDSRAGDMELAWHSLVGQVYLREGMNCLPPGTLTLVVSRLVVGAGIRPRSQTAVTQLELLPGATELALADLLYQDTGSVSITCYGRGGAAAGEDHWWMGGNPGVWRLECLDQLIAGSPRWITGLDASSVQAGLPARFVVAGVELPPGRYRVIPWEGAPEKFWVTFQVRAGEHTHVTVRGS